MNIKELLKFLNINMPEALSMGRMPSIQSTSRPVQDEIITSGEDLQSVSLAELLVLVVPAKMDTDYKSAPAMVTHGKWNK